MSGPADRFYQQGTYQFEHERIGRFNLFIVPVGKAGDGRFRYEAAFNYGKTETYYETGGNVVAVAPTWSVANGGGAIAAPSLSCRRRSSGCWTPKAARCGSISTT